MYKVLESTESLGDMNRRVRQIRSHFYSCQDIMRHEQLMLIQACAEFFMSYPKTSQKESVKSLFFNVYDLSKNEGKLITENVYLKLPSILKDYSLGKSMVSEFTNASEKGMD